MTLPTDSPQAIAPNPSRVQFCHACGEALDAFEGYCPQCGEWTGNGRSALSSPDPRLVVRGLTVESKGTRRLDRVDLEVTPGTLLAVLGTSGAGKSTLVKAIAGMEPATAGTVKLRGVDVYRFFETARRDIGYVQQEDVLYSGLTIFETLSYAAELRLPDGWSEQARLERISGVIEDLGLGSRAHARVDQLSGGQRKRVNLAIELLTEPPLLILDEPCSGLDPGTERAMMQLLRRLADNGRMVIVVTHSTDSLELCDRVLLLATGGSPVFNGAPGDLLGNFGCGSFTEVFAHLNGIEDPASIRLAAAPSEPRPPVDPARGTGRVAQRLRDANKDAVRRQLGILVRRYTRIRLSDRRAFVSIALQAPLLGLVMLAVFSVGQLGAAPGQAPESGPVLMALVLAAIYLGASNAVREIAKERPHLRREQNFGLSAWSYLLSKFAVLGAITIAQCVVLLVLGIARQQGPVDPVVLPWASFELLIVLIGAGLSALCLGLLISAISSNSDRALTSLPIVLFVQFLLAGLIFPVSTPGVAQLSWLVAARWGFSGSAATANYWQLRGCDLTLDCPSRWHHDAVTWLGSVGMLALLAVAAMAIALHIVNRRDPANVLARTCTPR